MKKYISFGVGIYFTLVTMYITYPLIFHMHEYIFGLGDELLITWILNWNIHAFIQQPLQIFNANIYYPYLNSLAFSDTFFTASLIAFLPVRLTGEPLVAYNFSYLFSLTTLGFFTYLLTTYLAKGKYTAGIIAGTLVAYSSYTLGKFMHLQIVSIQWVPLSLLFFFYFLDKRKIKYLIACAFFFLLQTYNSFLPGYFLLFCYSIILFSYWQKDKKIFQYVFTRRTLLITSITLLLLLPVVLPYYQVSKEFEYVRDIRDTIHFANRPEYILYPNHTTRLYPLLMDVLYKHDKGPFKHEGYLGGTLLIATILMIFHRWIKRKQKIPYQYMFLITAAIAYTMSLGSALQWGGKVIKLPFIIPLPYAIFYYVLPGFNGLRNSARWEMLVVFSLSIASGLWIAHMLRKQKTLIQLFVTVTICFLVIGEFAFPFHYEKVPTQKYFPAVYHAIAVLPKSAVILELPLYNWYMLPYSHDEQMRQYYSTSHFRNMINGGSGFSPPPWQDSTKKIVQEFPNDETVNYLKKIGVTHIVVHQQEYEQLEKNTVFVKQYSLVSDVQAKLTKRGDVQRIGKYGSDYLYEIL